MITEGENARFQCKIFIEISPSYWWDLHVCVFLHLGKISPISCRDLERHKHLTEIAYILLRQTSCRNTSRQDCQLSTVISCLKSPGIKYTPSLVVEVATGEIASEFMLWEICLLDVFESILGLSYHGKSSFFDQEKELMQSNFWHFHRKCEQSQEDT